MSLCNGIPSSGCHRTRTFWSRVSLSHQRCSHMPLPYRIDVTADDRTRVCSLPSRTPVIRKPVMSHGHSSTGIRDALAVSHPRLSVRPSVSDVSRRVDPAAGHPRSRVLAVIETTPTARARRQPNEPVWYAGLRASTVETYQLSSFDDRRTPA